MFTISKIKPRQTFKLKGNRANYVTRFNCAKDSERAFLNDQLNTLQNARSSAYQFKDNTSKKFVGVLFVTLEKINNKPSLVVDYLFVDKDYRGGFYPELDTSLSEMMIAFVYDLATKIDQHIALDLIALELASDKLIPTYKSMGFVTLKRGKNKSWMGMSVR